MFEDNTIIPSFFGTEVRGSVLTNESLNSTPLRVGEVKEIIYPDNQLSISGKYVEYTVEVIQGDGGSSYSSTLYHGCVVGQTFGGFADQLHYTLRKDEQTQGRDENGGVGVGSKVLLMCINGVRSNAVILCGLPDSKFSEDDKAKHSSELGHNLFFEFNGVQFNVNKDGELKATFRGATKTDGTLADSADANAEGSYIQINKDGNITIATPDDAQSIVVNHKDRKLEIQVQDEWNCNISGTVNITADENVNIRSSGVNVGDATDAWVLGTTYRRAETQMNSSVSSSDSAIAAALNSASISLQIAASLNAIPTVGGGLASTAFASVATTLGTIASQFSSKATAISSFESSASSFLSTKNKGD